MDGPAADFFYFFRIAHALDMLVCAEFQIDFIRIIDALLGELLADELGQAAAHLVAQRELAIRKRAGAGKAGCDMAKRLAIDAFLRLNLGAESFFYRLAFFHNGDFFLLPHFNISMAVKMPAGPAPTMTTSN